MARRAIVILFNYVLILLLFLARNVILKMALRTIVIDFKEVFILLFFARICILKMALRAIVIYFKEV